MFGVVLWSDSDDRKAVIWCEDQGDLAFFAESDDADVTGSSAFFEAGDMVQFDVRQEADIRKATNAHLIQGHRFNDLPGALRRDAKYAQPLGKVLPFPQRTQEPAPLTNGLRRGAGL